MKVSELAEMILDVDALQQTRAESRAELQDSMEALEVGACTHACMCFPSTGRVSVCVCAC